MQAQTVKSNLGLDGLDMASRSQDGTRSPGQWIVTVTFKLSS